MTIRSVIRLDRSYSYTCRRNNLIYGKRNRTMRKACTIVDARNLCKYDLAGGRALISPNPSSCATRGCGVSAIENLTSSGRRCCSLVVYSTVKSEGSTSSRHSTALIYGDRARRPSARGCCASYPALRRRLKATKNNHLLAMPVITNVFILKLPGTTASQTQSHTWTVTRLRFGDYPIRQTHNQTRSNHYLQWKDATPR